ncbi:MAG: site-specific DNA-methyltransferase [Ignavibacteriales bacterium]|nr:MAG: site-specific DNA-methyltransferase [Ignavibacteriales bacterium]
MKVKEPLFGYFNSEIIYSMINDDTFKVIDTFNREFDLIITSPPYNLGKEYEDKKSIEDYLNIQKKIIAKLVDVLSEKGSICWQVGNFVQNGEIFPLDIFYYDIFKQLKLKLRNRIIWHFEHGLHASKRFSGRYETILWFTKSDKYIFNLDEVRVPSKYPGKKHFKGPKKGLPSGNPRGKNPSDIWEIVSMDWNNEIWNIPNVKSNHPEKTIHQCQFPVELVERCILALTNEKESWVLDPFAGVGSTVIAAIKNNRNAIGIEKEKKYFDVANNRIDAFKEGELKLRPINKPIHIPSKNDKVAQYPKEWLKLNFKG